MLKKILLIAFSLMLMLTLTSCFIKPTIHITLIESENVSNIYENHYKLWLEEQTGFNIEINEITMNFSSQYLAQVIADGSLETDIVIINSGENLSAALTEEEAYALTDSFVKLDDYITEGTNLYSFFDEYAELEVRQQLNYNDELYFFPTINLSSSAKNGQSLWINAEWLENLELEVPKTTEDLIKVLYAFKTGDPNRNGIGDEIPFTGSVQSDDMKSHFALINAFTYFDYNNMGMYLEGGELRFSPTEDEFREALIYLKELYDLEHIHESLFTLSDSGVIKLANDPDSILGVFSATNLSDIISDEEDSFSNYINIAPLLGLEQNAVIQKATPAPAAAILSSANNPEDCFLLLDTMLSEEGFLVAMYGEEGKNWEYADSGDIDIYGEPATIKTRIPITGFLQNKHFDGVGMMVYYPHLTDGVCYTGYDEGYIAAEAFLDNMPHFREEQTINLSNLEIKSNDDISYRLDMLKSYIEISIEQFVTGEKSVESDEDWQEYLDGYFAFTDVFDDIEEALDL